MYLLQFLVLLKKVRDILIRNINVCPASQFAMFLKIDLPPGERMFINLYQPQCTISPSIPWS